MTPNSLSLIVGNAAFSDADYSLFCQKVQARFSVRLADYKPEQMRRRVAALAKQFGCETFLTYFGTLEKDTAALSAFMDLITINVTELFRNLSLFDELADHILPLIKRPGSGTPLNVWSAGCSYGAEAYTLAILLHERLGAGQFRIKGTDIDLTVLAKANSPSFTPADMAQVSKERRDQHFSSPDDKNFMPRLHLRQSVHFSRHDLLADEFPICQYDLILCRNVVIYFNDPAKERVYEGFHRALRPGGVLFVGGTERIASAPKIGLDVVRPFFYQKPLVAAKVAA